jgi:Tol biopolymer transport system component
VLAAGWASATGLAWSPREDEIWFTASAIGPNTSLWSVTTGGRKRQLLGPVGRMTLLDAEADGRLLVSQGRIRIVMAHRAELTAGDRILSWLDASAASDMSPDGSTLVFDEQGEGSQGNGYAVYLRKTDGSPAVRLGEGYGGALSKDLQWVAALRIAPARAVVLLPTGAGEARVLDRGPLRDLTAVTWMPDMQSVLISGQEDGKSPRLYLQPVSGGPPRAVSPDGFSFPTYASVVSPDGRWAAALNADKLPFLVSLADGTAHRLENAGAGDTPLRWTPDSSAVFLGRLGELPVTIWRVPQSGGRRERVTAIEPADRAGFIGVGSVQITPDGRQVAYSVGQYLADLYLTDPIR